MIKGLLKRPLPRHWAFYLALGLGLAVLAPALLLAPDLALHLGVGVMFASYAGFMAILVPHLDEAFLRAHAAEEDAPAPLLLAITIGLVAVAAGSLFYLLNGPTRMQAIEVLLATSPVLLGWFAINIMWAMHYAYEYYEVADPAAKSARGARAVVGGLTFPGSDQPDGAAFLYFSFVLGMTAQTSDVAVTSNKMRRAVLLHGIFSFLFNTVIVAATVNIVVALA